MSKNNIVMMQIEVISDSIDSDNCEHNIYRFKYKYILCIVVKERCSLYNNDTS